MSSQFYWMSGKKGTGVLTSSLNVDHFAINLLVSVEPDVGNKDVAIVQDEIFDDLWWAVVDIYISPVNPAMLWPERCGKQIVPCPRHGFSARALCLETVSIMHFLRKLYLEIFLYDCCRMKCNFGVALHSLQFLCQCGLGIVLAVAYEKSEVYQVVRICKRADKVEVLREKFGRLAHRRENKHPLLSLDRVDSRLYVV